LFEGNKLLMTRQDASIPISFRVFLWLVAVVFAAAAIILIISVTSAATATGSAPSLAVSLVAGPNTGVIAPGGQRWFRLQPGQPGQAINLEQSLTLIFTPDNGQHVKRVSLQIFEENQLPFFYLGDASHMANLGAGQIVSRDHNPQTGELFWTGWLASQKNYYIQLLNGNDAPLDYWLFTDDVVSYPLEQPAAPAAPVTSAAPIIPAPPENGTDPGIPLSLQPGLTRGSLKPKTTHWYVFSHTDPANPSQFQNLTFSLFFTPGDGDPNQVNFKLFPARAMEMWRHGETDQLINFGAGMLVSRDGDGNTGERLWSGTVIKGETYLLAVENGAEVTIDYWLFDADINNPELGP
jgi:hypothetical protein